MKILPNRQLLWGTQTLPKGVIVDVSEATAAHLIAEGVAEALPSDEADEAPVDPPVDGDETKAPAADAGASKKETK